LLEENTIKSDFKQFFLLSRVWWKENCYALLMSFETTGTTVERELFGKAEKLARVPEYLKYKQAMEVVRKLQPGDPTDPKPDFAYEVLIQVEGKIPDGKDRIRFYTAIGSMLDHWHGVDGWFELEDGRRVSIDLTTNPQKETHKADIVFLVPHGGLDRAVNEAEFLEYTGKLAGEIAGLFQDKGPAHN
jgi:hypothetical protein